MSTNEREVDWASLRCPNNSLSTLPTPTYGSEGKVFMGCAEVLINAPAKIIYNTLLDFKNYHTWNSFVVNVTLPPEVDGTPAEVYIGMPMTFTTNGLIPLSNTTSNEIVTVLQDDSGKGYLMNAWKFSPPLNASLILPAEHPNILTDAGDGLTRYLSYETYYAGLATPLVYGLKTRLQAAFERQGRDLKDYVESL